MKSHSSHKLHIPDFLILVIILIVGATLILVFNTNRYLQQISVVGLSLAYFLWGMIHHLKSKDHHWYIFLEYFLVAALGAAILLPLIINA